VAPPVRSADEFCDVMNHQLSFRDSSAAQAGGYVLAISALLVVVGLIFHPVPAGGFEEKPSVLQNTPWWGPIHVAIAVGFVLCVLGSLLMLIAGGSLTRVWALAAAWGAMAVGHGVLHRRCAHQRLGDALPRRSSGGDR
jgi:protein-S-isoprenylcysteine O-methyltransferase Ste14